MLVNPLLHFRQDEVVDGLPRAQSRPHLRCAQFDGFDGQNGASPPLAAASKRCELLSEGSREFIRVAGRALSSRKSDRLF